MIPQLKLSGETFDLHEHVSAGLLVAWREMKVFTAFTV
jgi:hypothetical protein